MDDEGYSSESESFLSTLDTQISCGVEENGRLYPSYGRHEYGLPVDEREQKRNVLRHRIFSVLEDLCGSHTQMSPDPFLSAAGSRALDLGTGSGLWAVDIADRFPQAEIIGTDIAPIQPRWVPPNCSFEVDDAEADWLYPVNHFDFIHARELLLSIRDWPRLIRQAYRTLRPGGWLQLACIIPLVKSDDNTLPVDSAIRAAGDTIIDVGECMGASPEAARYWSSDLEQAGFDKIHEDTIHLPLTPWNQDGPWRIIGSMERDLFSEGLESMLLRGWTRSLGRSREDLASLIKRAKGELNDASIHAYYDLRVVCGQRPLVDGPHGFTRDNIGKTS